MMLIRLLTFFYKRYLLPGLVVVFVYGCGGVQPLREVFKKQTPYEKYEQALKSARLENTALGKEWIAAGERSLRDSLSVTLPFKETGYFASDKPTAISFRLEARRGQRLVIGTEIKANEPVQLFIDVFELNGNLGRPPKHVAAADTNSASLTYEVEEDQVHLIRLQPELLRSGNYTISITREPTLAFPVQGKSSRQVGSVWGVPRDGGARRHEGIDIFAKKGTPVIASAEGYISAVNENKLGGKVVWLADEKRRQTLYYAHLDSQLVRSGQRVRVGDTIGLVGNTGNARTTAPHLHFGIYRFSRGAFDPLPSVQMAAGSPQPVVADMSRLATWARTAKKGTIRLSPDAKSTRVSEIARHTLIYISAGTKDWYKVMIPGRITGYILSSLVENMEKPLRSQRIREPALLRDQPDTTAPYITRIEAGTSLPVLAEAGLFLYVRTPDGFTGWVSKAESAD